jgi:hypothetical protein
MLLLSLKLTVFESLLSFDIVVGPNSKAPEKVREHLDLHGGRAGPRQPQAYPQAGPKVQHREQRILRATIR